MSLKDALRNIGRQINQAQSKQRSIDTAKFEEEAR